MPIVPWLSYSAISRLSVPESTPYPTDAVIRRFLHQLVYDGMRGTNLPLEFADYTEKWDGR